MIGRARHSVSTGLNRIGRFVAIATLAFTFQANGQLENVPVDNPVYEFLKRMEVKGIIEGYYNVVLPISREEVAKFLNDIERQRLDLSTTDRGFLDDFKIEFGREMGLEKDNEVSILSGEGSIFSDKQKSVYIYRDSSGSFYFDLIGGLSFRSTPGDRWDGKSFSTITMGPRFRGSLGTRLGYYLKVEYFRAVGNKALALSFPAFRRSSKFQRGEKSFEETEGYLRLDVGAFRLQLGRERFLWGRGYNSRLVVSDNASIMDFARIDANLGKIRYTFFHSWILGQEKLIRNPYAGFLESSIESKYFVAHRVELSLPRKFNWGVGEVVVYSRRFPDLAYLNPVNFYKAIEPEFHNRDNSLVTTDLSLFIHPGIEIFGSLLVDDIEWGKIGSDYFGNKFAYNAGITYIEPLGLENTDLTFEYTKIDPYVYSHQIPENNYAHDQISIGNPIGPNSESLWLRGSYRPSHRLRVSGEAERQRHGENVVDAFGNLVRNVGGDVLFGKRLQDANDVPFLDGVLTKTYRFAMKAVYEFVNQWFLEMMYEFRYQRNVSLRKTSKDHLLFIQLRLDL